MIKFRDIVKTQNIIRVSPSDTLSAALSKLSTSHDAAFVFSENKRFLGLINPYYCFIQSSYPGNAKVEHCLFHPPRLKAHYPIPRVANLMIESKIHYLPVFDQKDVFSGIISSRHLLSVTRDYKRFQTKIGDILSKKKRPLLTIYEDDPISTAISLFKQYKVSKLVIINHDLRLKGILSYYDLINFLITPKVRSHGEREGNKTSLYNQRVKNFGKSYVLTLSKTDTMTTALNMILDKNIGSVVIVDADKRPLGIITTRDFLKLLVQPGLGVQFELMSKDISDKSRYIINRFFHHLSLIPKKFADISKVKLFVKEEKQGGVFKVALSLIPKKGQVKIIKKEGKNLLDVLKKIKKN